MKKEGDPDTSGWRIYQPGDLLKKFDVFEDAAWARSTVSIRNFVIFFWVVWVHVK
ncbi:hypothetical protein KKG31_01540 [Patescibacteria group bacterium]|nr:hypothetical protein [Patescibacteria group bacterium]